MRLTISLVMAFLTLASGCRNKADEDRVPLTSHHGTEPPQETHESEKFKRAVDDSKPADPDQHEEGEVKVGEKWEFPVAVTRKGMLWGTIEESRGGKRILSFKGIRYAQPPIGPLRFKPPKMVPEWTGIVDAKMPGHMCPQHMYYKPDVWIGNEDCLFLNVYTRDMVKAKARPVIVFIHGGNFVRGSGNDYQPDYLLDEEVVLVTINYRLGMFGFLSTEDKEAPGNYGMLDQVAALRWVKENIHAFSGDPNKVTIMGQQAGGAAVHYHLLSPLSRGLFSRAISMSGSALCWWASIKRPLEKAKKLARLLECPYTVLHDGSPNGDVTTKAMVECLKGKTMEQMMNTHPNFYEWKHLEQSQEPITAWSPRVDAPESPLPFLPVEPIDLITQGSFQHVPWIVGLTDDEGAFKASAFFSDPKSVAEFNDQFEKLGPLIFGFHDGQTEAPKMNAAKVRDHYWGQELTMDNAKGFVDAISDSSYAHPIDTASKIHAMKSKAAVYVYHFGYKGSNSFSQLQTNEYPPKQIKTDIQYGVGNQDDLIYLFPVLSGTFRPLPHDDLLFSRRYIRLLTSFVADGKPVVKSVDVNGQELDEVELDWTPVLTSNATHLDIGKEVKMDLGLPNNDSMKFWMSVPAYWIADRENYKPAPPPVLRDEL